MKSRTCFIILFLFLCTGLPAARATDTLTWEDCVKLTWQYNPELAAARERNAQVITNKLIAKKRPDPRVSMSTSTSASRTKNLYKSGQENPKNYTASHSYGASVSASKTLFDGFKDRIQLKLADEAMTSQSFQYQVTLSDIRLRLRSAFIELLNRQELATITQQILRRQRDNFNLVILSYRAGREHHGSVLTSYADLALASLELIKLHRGQSLWKKRLEKELGCPLSDDFKVAGALRINEERGKRPDFQALADNSPFLRNLMTLKETARLNVEAAKADFLPVVSADSSLSKSSDRLPMRGHSMSLGFSVSMPLFDGYDRKGALENSLSSLRERHADIRSGRMGVLYTLEEAWVNLQNAVNDIQSQKIILQAAEERANIMRKKYFSGLATFEDWSAVENSLASSISACLNAKTSAMSAEAQWFQAKGGTLEYAN